MSQLTPVLWCLLMYQYHLIWTQCLKTVYVLIFLIMIVSDSIFKEKLISASQSFKSFVTREIQNTCNIREAFLLNLNLLCNLFCNYSNSLTL